MNLPPDLKAETLVGYIPRHLRDVVICGSHKRSAYEDIAGMTDDGNGRFIISLARNGMYDILPECLFHPVDRFDNLPANEYKKRFKEEYEQQQMEEEKARRFFQHVDKAVVELSAIVSELKYEDEVVHTLENIICDKMPLRYSQNRFVRRTKEFLPACCDLRGNEELLSLMLRKVLFDENIRLYSNRDYVSFSDSAPRYLCGLDDVTADNTDEEVYLGNEFDEEMLIYHLVYWSDEECNDGFLAFVKEIEDYEDFLNDYFMSIECQLKFRISMQALPLRLSDDVFFNYLDYNTNL